MYCRARNTPNASAARGTMTAQYESTQPSWATIRNCGTMITWTGIISVLTISRNSRLRPGNRYFAKTKPASRLIPTVSSTATTAISSELTYQVANGSAVQARLKLPRSSEDGHRCSADPTSSACGLSAVTSIQ